MLTNYSSDVFAPTVKNSSIHEGRVTGEWEFTRKELGGPRESPKWSPNLECKGQYLNGPPAEFSFGLIV